MPLAEVHVSILDRVFGTIANSKSPEEILALHSTLAETERLDTLVAMNRTGKLSDHESLELHHYFLAERYVRKAKAHAFAQKNGFSLE